MTDSYVQIAPDSTGKKMATDAQTDSLGNAVQVQKAMFVGDGADALSQMLEINRQQLACLRALLRCMTDISNSRITEEDFSSQTGVNFDG